MVWGLPQMPHDALGRARILLPQHKNTTTQPHAVPTNQEGGDILRVPSFKSM